MNEILRLKIRNIIKEYYDFYPDFFDPLANPNIHGFIGRKDTQGLSSVEMNEESVLDEGAVDFIGIPPTVGLVMVEDSFRGNSLILFDFKVKKCIGYMSIGNFSERANVLHNIAADKGYGPIMTECGMMSSYPKGIMVDRSGPTRQNVWDMLKKFSIQRGDIKKDIIIEGDMEYDGRYIKQGDENRQYIMNLIFSRTPSTWYKKIIDRGLRLSNENDIDSSEIQNIGRAYFNDRYENG